MNDQTQLPFFSAGHDLPLFSEQNADRIAAEVAIEADEFTAAELDDPDVCTCNHPPHHETRQWQYDKALAALELRREAGAMTTDGYNWELTALNADYPECAR